MHVCVWMCLWRLLTIYTCVGVHVCPIVERVSGWATEKLIVGLPVVLQREEERQGDGWAEGSGGQASKFNSDRNLVSVSTLLDIFLTVTCIPPPPFLLPQLQLACRPSNCALCMEADWVLCLDYTYCVLIK